MTLHGISELESAFIAQHEIFLEAARSRFPDAPTSIDQVVSDEPCPARPIVIDDLGAPTPSDLEAVAYKLLKGNGVVHVVPQRFSLPTRGEPHPLLRFAARLKSLGVIGYPVDHPMEGHPEALARFGQPDGTLKLYDLPIPQERDKYREQAETNEMFASHNDGLGYAGLIRHAIMTLDRPPMAGGYTYFQNLVKLAPALAGSDPEAFEALFLPDAITALRPRGKGAIRVTSPVFFVGCSEEPQVFFRIASGEYQIDWRNHPALTRARALLERVCRPFGPGSGFIHFMRPGDTVIVDNSQVVHGRTAFIDPPIDPPNGGRVLARKWFVRSAEDAAYRHVPGIAVHETWARLFSDRFCGEAVQGEWHYDLERQCNVQIL